jgi:hypothetical protein
MNHCDAAVVDAGRRDGRAQGRLDVGEQPDLVAGDRSAILPT